MKKLSALVLLGLFYSGACFGKIMPGSIENSVALLKKELSPKIDKFVTSGSQKDLQALTKGLPTGPEKIEDPQRFRLEKDVFFSSRERNKAAIEMLEKKTKKLKNKNILAELDKLIINQKQIKKGWEVFWESWSKDEWEKKMVAQKKSKKESPKKEDAKKGWLSGWFSWW